jgi:hypothetical protein
VEELIGKNKNKLNSNLYLHSFLNNQYNWLTFYVTTKKHKFTPQFNADWYQLSHHAIIFS